MSDVALSVPALPEFVHIVRAVVAGVAAALDTSYERCEDLRLAADEACVYLLGTSDAPSELSIQVQPSGDGMEIVVSRDAGRLELPTNGEALAWRILEAFVDDVDLRQSDGRSAIHFSKRLRDV